MLHRAWLAGFVVALVCIGANPVLADGKLSRARSESRGESTSRSSSSSGSSHSSSSSRRSSRSSDSSAVVYPSYWNSRRSHHHHHDRGSTVYVDSYSPYADVYEPALPDAPPATYATYPYANKGAAYILEPTLQVASSSSALDAQLYAEHPKGQLFSAQLRLDAGFMSGVGQSTLGARILMPGRFELSAHNAVLWEPAARDYSILGSADLGLRFFQASAVTMRATIGVAYFGQLGTVEAGPQLGLGMDLFIGRPWVLSLEAAAASVGEAVMPQARVQLGYMFGRSEVFFGYQYLQIGSVGLSAPLLGTRIWL